MQMLLGITHGVSPRLDQGELTYINRESLDYALALQQHDHYCSILAAHGVDVKKLAMNSSYPDSCFVEDTAIVLDEIAIITSMGTASRRGETAGIATELSKYREIATIQLPATIEGGDVLRIGKTLLVGLSSRTNAQGIEALINIVKRLGYTVVPVPVTGCLHLKTACTAINGEILLVNPPWINITPLRNYTLLPVSPDEPWAANIICVDDIICAQAGFPKTLAKLQTFSSSIEIIDISEFRKVEAGLSCLSILFQK